MSNDAKQDKAIAAIGILAAITVIVALGAALGSTVTVYSGLATAIPATGNAMYRAWSL